VDTRRYWAAGTAVIGLLLSGLGIARNERELITQAAHSGHNVFGSNYEVGKMEIRIVMSGQR